MAVRPEWKLTRLLTEVEAAAKAAEEEIQKAKAEAEAAKQRADRAEAEKEAAEECEEAARQEAAEEVKQANLDRQIEAELRQRAEAVNQQLKRQVNDTLTEKHREQDARLATELELAEAREVIKQKEEALEEERYRHALTEEARAELQEELEKEQDLRRDLEVDKSLNKRFVPEHCFCERCHRPTREWDGQRWLCWRCDR